MEEELDQERIMEHIKEVQRANRHRLDVEKEMLVQESINEGLMSTLLNIRDMHQKSGNKSTVALIDSVLLLCDANVVLRNDMWEKLSRLSQVQMEQKNLNEHEKQHIFFEANLDLNESAVYKKSKQRAYAPQRPYQAATISAETNSRNRSDSSTSGGVSGTGTMLMNRSTSMINLSTPDTLRSAGVPSPSEADRKLGAVWEEQELPSSEAVYRGSIEALGAQLPFDHVSAGDGKRCLDKLMVTLRKNTPLLGNQTDQLIFSVNVKPLGSTNHGINTLNSRPRNNARLQYNNHFLRIVQGDIMLQEVPVSNSTATVSMLEVRINPSAPLEFQLWNRTPGGGDGAADASNTTVEEGPAPNFRITFTDVDGGVAKERKGGENDEASALPADLTQCAYLGSQQLFVSQLHKLALSPLYLSLDLMSMGKHSSLLGAADSRSPPLPYSQRPQGGDGGGLGGSAAMLFEPIPTELPPGWEHGVSRDGTPFLLQRDRGDTAWKLGDTIFGLKRAALSPGAKGRQLGKNSQQNQPSASPADKESTSSSSSSPPAAPLPSSSSTSPSPAKSSKLAPFDRSKPLSWVGLTARSPLPSGGIIIRTEQGGTLLAYVKNRIALSMNGEHRYAMARDGLGSWSVLGAHGRRIKIMEAKAPSPTKISSPHEGQRSSSQLKKPSSSEQKRAGGGAQPPSVQALEVAYRNRPPFPLTDISLDVGKVILRRRELPSETMGHSFGFAGEWEPGEAMRIRDNLLVGTQKPMKRRSRKLQPPPKPKLSNDIKAPAAPSSSTHASSSSSSSPPPTPSSEAKTAPKPMHTYPFDHPDGKNNIMFGGEETKRGGRALRCATLDKLIERVTHPHFPTNILNIFLLMYHSFTTPRELLARLVSRYFMPTPMNMVPDELREFQTTQRIVRLRVKNLVKSWIHNHYTDFQDDPVLKQGMRDFLSLIGYDKLGILETGPRELLESKQEIKKSVLPGNTTEETYNFATTGNREQDIETARQLSLMAFDEYSKIRMRDVLDKIFESKENVHIRNLVNFFNNMSKLVQYTIVSEERLKQRVALIGKFAFIAWECRTQNNFLMSYAISAGLGSNPIYRLKKTKELLGQRTMEKMAMLNQLYAKGAGSDQYRNALKHAVDNPCVPYIGTTLKDLTFMHDGNKDTVCGMVNFYKRVLMSDSIQQLDQFQRKRYLFAPVNFIQDQLRRDFTLMETEKGSEQYLYDKSLEREPRE